VEDDPTAAHALSEILRHLDCEVVVATSVQVALRAIRARDFDHALLDLMLPDGNGSEVLSAIRAAGLPIRVTVISAAADEEMLRLTRSHRPDAFLAKPLDLRKLIAAMGI
jgi:DNA-binding response OmpR family regulator